MIKRFCDFCKGEIEGANGNQNLEFQVSSQWPGEKEDAPGAIGKISQKVFHCCNTCKKALVTSAREALSKKADELIKKEITND
jgi:hypothetical protein